MNKNINLNEILMHEDEIKLIIKYLNKIDTFFEWGSGGSTFNFSKLVKEYYSVEHDKIWFDKVNGELKNKSITNVKYFYKSPNKIKFDQKLDDEAHNLSKYRNPTVKNNIYYHGCRGIPTLDWHCYIDYINCIELPNKKFSKILVDGRARNYCAYKALDYLEDDGILFVHDWCRKYYHSILDYYTIVDETTTPNKSNIVALKKIK